MTHHTACPVAPHGSMLAELASSTTLQRSWFHVVAGRPPATSSGAPALALEHLTSVAVAEAGPCRLKVRTEARDLGRPEAPDSHC